MLDKLVRTNPYARSAIGSVCISLFAVSLVAQSQPTPNRDKPASGGKIDVGASSVIGRLPHADQISADATCYVYRMGREQLLARLRDTDAGNAIADPAVQAFFDELQRLAHRKDGRSHLLDFALDALHQELVMSYVKCEHAPNTPKLDTPAEAAGEQAPAPSAPGDFAIITPSAATRADFRKKLDPAVENWPANSSRADVAGHEFAVLADSADDIYTGWVDGFQGQSEPTLLWCKGKETLESVLKPCGGRTLAKSEFFQASLKPVFGNATAPPIAMYYYDLRPAWEAAAAGPAAAIWSQLSWHNIDSVSGATFVEGKGLRNRHYWKLNDQRAGLFQYSQTERINDDWLKRIPADASGFTTGLFDGQSFVLTLMTLGTKLFGGSDESLAAAGAGSLLVQPTARLVGPHFLVYRVPTRYGNFPFEGMMPAANLVGAIELKDVDAFYQAVSGLVAMSPGLSHSFELNGHRIITVNAMYFTLHLALMPDSKAKLGDGKADSAHGVLLATIHASLLKDAIENWDSPGPSIVDSAAFKAAQKHRLLDACFMMYFPPGGFARGIYDHYIPQFQQALAMLDGLASFIGGARPSKSEADQGLRAILLPRGRDLTRHVTDATILTARDDGAGILFDGYAPLLSTPYYWAYCHAILHLQPGGFSGLPNILSYLTAAIPSDEAAPNGPTHSPE